MKDESGAFKSKSLEDFLLTAIDFLLLVYVLIPTVAYAAVVRLLVLDPTGGTVECEAA